MTSCAFAPASGDPTPSDPVGSRPAGPAAPAAELRAGRAALLGRGLAAADLRAALTDFYDERLAALMPALDGVALVAVGSLGRREVMPFGDVDLLAVHSGQPDLRSAVEQVWYPLWDAGIALDHSVRTADEAIALAGRDLAVALGLLAARPIGGDTDAGAGLRARAREAWRRAARTRLEEVATGARAGRPLR